MYTKTMTLRNYAFGPFVFDTQRKILLKRGTPVIIGQKCSALLETLLDAEGHAVSKSTLLLAAWRTENIEESNLAVQIAALRKALGRTRHGTEWVTTVQRVGYQFVNPDQLEIAVLASPESEQTLSDKPSLAVLPFVNLSSDPEQDFFSDGVTSDIITELSRWRLLSIRSRWASFQYRSTLTDLKHVASELKVRYVVNGSVRRMAGRIRIAVELVDAESGNQVWAEKFDREANDIFAVQDQVVRTIVSTLVGRVIVASVELANRKPPNSLAAYECVLKGNALSWGNAGGAVEARKLFAKAIELDPNYGVAHALLGTMCFDEWYRDLDNQSPFPQKALDLARRAVELDSNESTCFSILAQLHLANRAFEPALLYIQRAIELNPNNQWNAADMGIIQNYLGHADVAIGHFKRACEIDPYFDPPWYFRHLGQTYMSLHRYDEALATFELCPVRTFRIAANMAGCYARTNQTEHAADCVDLCLSTHPNFSISKYLFKEPYQSAVELAYLKESLTLAGLPE